MLPSSAHVNRILIRHFNLLNTTSLINFNSYFISCMQWALIKHAATAHGRFFFDCRNSSSIFNWLLHNAGNLHYACRLLRTLIVCISFHIWLWVPTHVFDTERPSTNFNNKCVFDDLLIRSRLRGWYYRLLAHLHYSPVSIGLGVSTSLLVVLNNDDLRAPVRFLIILLSMKKHAWHSSWRRSHLIF